MVVDINCSNDCLRTFDGICRMTHHILLFVRHTMDNSWSLGFLSLSLVVIPIIGMDLVHKHGWEHWEPFVRKHE